MRAIQKRIVTDEEMRPVAVQIDYQDWLEIERLLDERWPKDEPSGARGEDFEALADELGSSWQGGDGLEYQIRLREEWEGR